jgi:Major Facilitator Superfamily
MAQARLVTLVCLAQVCAQIGAYTWPALLPGFIADWHITNGEAGWITGLFYAAYTVSVPFLVTLTDRVDPRSVYLTGVGLTVVSHLGFAGFADGPWSAATARVLAGVGWAGTYMTGLKLLADRVEPALMSRAVAGHAASIGIAGAVSFLVRGPLEPLARMARGVRRGRRRDRDRLADHRPVGARSDAPLRPRAAPTRHPPARSSTSDPCCGTAPPWPTPSRTAPTPGK